MAALRMDGLFEVIGGMFSTDLDRSRASATEYGLSPTAAFSSLDGLIDQMGAELDVVVILSPTPSHHRQVDSVLKQGLSVICEKTLAETARDIKQIRQTEKQVQESLIVVFNYTGYPMVRAMRQMIADGRIGHTFRVEAVMPQEGFIRLQGSGRPFPVQDWRLQEGSPPRVSLDLGVHAYSLAAFVTGRHPQRVVAQTNSFGHHEGVWDSIDALAATEEGYSALFSFGKVSLGHRNGLAIRVFGTAGSMSWSQERSETLKFADAKGRIQLLDRSDTAVQDLDIDVKHRFKVGHPSGFVEALANYYASSQPIVACGATMAEDEVRNWVMGSRMSLRAAQFLEAIESSSRRGEWEFLADS